MANKPDYVVFTDSMKALDYVMRIDSFENMVITENGRISETRDDASYVQDTLGGEIRCTKYSGNIDKDDSRSIAVREISANLRPFRNVKKEGEFYIEFNARSPFFAPWD